MRQLYGKVTHLISIADSDDAEHIPSLGIPQNKRLSLLCSDVERASEALEREREMPGSICLPPTLDMVEKALNFARQLSENDTLLVCCLHGVSRSTAVALAVLRQADPTASNQDVVRRLLVLRPEACPNALIVEYADKLLNRGGDLLQAVLKRK